LFAPLDGERHGLPDLVLGTEPGEDELKIARANGIRRVY